MSQTTPVQKKPKSNFMLFCDDMRGELKTQNPQLKQTEIAKECAKLWHALAQDKKDVYTAKYNELKSKYVKPEPLESKPVVEKKVRPKNAYINFCSQTRASLVQKNKDLGPKDIMRLLGEEWNKLSISEKEKYKSDQQCCSSVTQSCSTKNVKPEVVVKQESKHTAEPIVEVPKEIKKRGPKKVKNEPTL